MAFVVRDNVGAYVGENSLAYDRDTYCYSPYLTNGYNTYPTKEQAEKVLHTLQERSKILQIDRTWHVEEIDIRKTIIEESIVNIPKYPFVYQAIREIEEIA